MTTRAEGTVNPDKGPVPLERHRSCTIRDNLVTIKLLSGPYRIGHTGLWFLNPGS
jgi:hypothetical protein